MKHFVVDIRYLVPIEQIDAALAAHRSFLNEGYERGWLLMSGPKSPRVGGIMLARAESRDELYDYLMRDPFAVRHLAGYSLTEFDPVKRQAFMQDWVAKES